MKKFYLFLLLGLAVFTLTACDPGTETPECTNGQVLNDKGVCEDPAPTMYTVTFDTDGGSVIAAVEVEPGQSVTMPEEPTKEGYVFVEWWEQVSNFYWNFDRSVDEDITLVAQWVEAEPTNEELIQADYEALLDTFIVSPFLLDLPVRGPVNRSAIEWSSNSDYISSNGVVLPLAKDAEASTGTITGTFSFKGTEVEYTFDVPLTPMTEVVIDEMVNVPFENLTTEYEVEDGTVDLYFEEDGAVPYIKVTDFIDMLDGAIDPTTVFTVDTTDGVLTIQYDYYDAEEDYTYEMILTVDSVENTVTVNDPAFFWAYGTESETNYGRHIEYIQDHPEESYDEGEELFYDLDDYNMDIVVYQDEVLLPYYMANQLLGIGIYYNVYYNGDGLFGTFYYLSSGSEEFDIINNSSKRGTDLPVDLVIHTFNMLAFDLDYFYGLKDIMEVDSYYELLYSKRDRLLTTDPKTLDEGLSYLAYKQLAEPHTNYGSHSYYNSSSYDGPQIYISSLGGRHADFYDKLDDVDAAIGAKWGIASGRNYVNKPDYWFLDDVTVSLTLNDFNTSDIEESLTYDKTISEDILEVANANAIFPAISQGSKFWMYNSSTEEDAMLEMIVKGVDASYLATYEAALVSNGAVKTVSETDSTLSAYVITVNAVEYTVIVGYNTDYKAFYLGVNVTTVEDLATFLAEGMEAYVREVILADSAVYMELALEQIVREVPGVENVMLDLTWNTGGNVGALSRVVGFITDDPFAVSRINRGTGSTSTSFTDIGDGIQSYDHLSWSLLISPVTFSAANSMATIFQANDLGPVLGIQSGGGACSITPLVLPNGTSLTMSSNSISAYRTGAGTTEDPYVFHDVEFGIVPDHVLTYSTLFDEDTILAIINPS